MDTETVEMEKCWSCDEDVDPQTDYYYSNVKDSTICGVCFDSDLQTASILNVVNENGLEKYIIGDLTHMTEYGDDLHGTNLKIDRTWVSSDAWRGHYETTIEGWSEVLTGWTTGGWDDEIGRRKQRFNEWAELLVKQEITPPVPVALVCDPTSNVFSMGISVLSPQPNQLKEWLDEEFDSLYDSLS